jgi:integrase
LAAGIARVKSAKSIGVRMGNWLSLKQAQALLNAPDITSVKGLRDRAIIAVLLGCGLRRSEVLDLEYGITSVRFSIGIRNANDKSMRLAMCIGYRVLVCDNMAFGVPLLPEVLYTGSYWVYSRSDAKEAH